MALLQVVPSPCFCSCRVASSLLATASQPAILAGRSFRTSLSYHNPGAVAELGRRSRRRVLASGVLLTLATAGGGLDKVDAEETKASSTTTGAQIESVFVAGAAGNTGKRVVKELLSKGFKVRAGVRDVSKAKDVLPTNSNIELVVADVTDSPERLASAIGSVDAVICATGFRPSLFDPLASWKVDNLGTVNLVDACKKNGVSRFVLVSSLLTNGAAVGQVLNPAYVFLNIVGLTLIAKLQAEQYIRRSGINYTIVRPGGLRNEPPSGNVVLQREDTLFEGSISRDYVAQVAVEALQLQEASFKVVEVVARPDAPKKTFQELFASV